MPHVIPASYANASGLCYAMSFVVDHNRWALLNALRQCENMSGSDETGKAWGDMFDENVKHLFDLTEDLVAGLNNYGGVLYQGAANHLDAEKASGGADDAQLPPECQGGVANGTCVMMPTAGGPGMGMQTITELANAIGVPVPDGDTDKLEKAHAALVAFADSLYQWQSHSLPQGQSGPVALPSSSDALGGAADSITELDSPEVDVIVGYLEELQSAVEDVQESARQLAKTCLDHRDWLNKIRGDMKNQLEELGKEIAIGIVVGVALSFVTVGVGALLEAANAAEKIARAAKIVRDVLEAAKGAQALGKAGYLKDVGRVARWKKQLERFKYLRKIQRSNMKDWQKGIAKKGRFGEDAAGVDPNVPKRTIRINNRDRVPDKIDDELHEVMEVKNTNKIGFSEKSRLQITDDIAYAKQRGYKFVLSVDNRTQLSPEIQQLVDQGKINLRRIDMSR